MCIRDSPNDATLVEEAVDALANLAAASPGKDLVKANDGVRILEAAKVQHPGIEGVAEYLKSVKED